MSVINKAIEYLNAVVSDYHSGEDHDVTYRLIDEITSWVYWYENYVPDLTDDITRILKGDTQNMSDGENSHTVILFEDELDYHFLSKQIALILQDYYENNIKDGGDNEQDDEEDYFEEPDYYTCMCCGNVQKEGMTCNKCAGPTAECFY